MFVLVRLGVVGSLPVIGVCDSFFLCVVGRYALFVFVVMSVLCSVVCCALAFVSSFVLRCCPLLVFCFSLFVVCCCCLLLFVVFWLFVV